MSQTLCQSQQNNHLSMAWPDYNREMFSLSNPQLAFCETNNAPDDKPMTRYQNKGADVATNVCVCV